MELAAFRRYDDINKEDAGFLFLVFTLPLYTGFYGVTVAWILLFTLVRVVKQKTINLIGLDWFLPALFFYFLISGLATGQPLSSMEKRLPFLVMPFLFALNPNLFRLPFRNRVLIAFILGNVLALLICFARALVRSISFSNGEWHFNSRVYPDQTYDILTSSVMGGNYFFGSEFSYFFDQVTYFGIYLVIGQVFVYFLYRTGVSFRFKVVLIIIYILFASALFLLSSKAAIITSFLFNFYLLLNVRVARWLKLLFIALFILTSGFFFLKNPRLKVFLENFAHSIQQVDPNAKYGHRLRILSWDASLEVIKDNWLSGVGEGKKETALIEMYNNKRYIFPAQRLYNSHNQYLDLLLGGGIMLLCFFIAGLVMFWLRGLRHRNELVVLFLGVIAFNLLFENLLSRHAGIVIFSTFLGYLSGLKEHGNSVRNQPRPYESPITWR